MLEHVDDPVRVRHVDVPGQDVHERQTTGRRIPARAFAQVQPEVEQDVGSAVVAGHVIECGTQATGGNYSFFTEVPDLSYAGFPLAEINADGSSVITKHPGTGGLVSTDTVTAQLLYEITGARYANPDVTARMDTIELSTDGPDRVRIRAGSMPLQAPPRGGAAQVAVR